MYIGIGSANLHSASGMSVFASVVVLPCWSLREEHKKKAIGFMPVMAQN